MKPTFAVLLRFCFSCHSCAPWPLVSTVMVQLSLSNRGTNHFGGGCELGPIVFQQIIRLKWHTFFQQKVTALFEVLPQSLPVLLCHLSNMCIPRPFVILVRTKADNLLAHLSPQMEHPAGFRRFCSL